MASEIPNATRDPSSLIWMLTAVIVLICTLQMTHASLQDGIYQPVGHDAFYHGARMLAVANGEPLPQFDHRMHAPQGDWVQWPWAYDYFMGRLAGVVGAVLGLDNSTVLMHLPVGLALAGLAFTVAIARSLGFPASLITIAALAFSVHAFTQYQFGVGALDHHGAEQLLTLATLWLGLRWLQRPKAVARAAWLGGILGCAIGVHTGLFILQIPVVLTLLVSWVQGWQPPLRAAAAFVISLIGITVLMLVPALIAGYNGFDLHHLSWFHLYVAFATSVIVLATTKLRCSWPHGAALMLGVIALLGVPLIASVTFLGRFASGELATIARIDEIRSPFALIRDELGVRRLSQVYTLLVWFAPVVLIGSLIKAVRARRLDRRYFWCMSAFGLVLLLAQQRLAVFGVWALYLPILVALTDLWAERPIWRRRTLSAVTAVFVIAYLPTVFWQLSGSRIPSMDEHYSTARVVLPALIRACTEAPGVVLADPGDGHLIRYFTQCPVIANNFRLTQTDVRKIDEALDLIQSPLAELRTEAPFVRYVLARLIMPAESSDPKLFEDLLRRDGDLPAGVIAIVEAAVQRADGAPERFLGVYKISEALPDDAGRSSQAAARPLMPADREGRSVPSVGDRSSW